MLLKRVHPSSLSKGAAALALVAAACSTPTTETNVWRSPTYAGGADEEPRRLRGPRA